jgi:hypothetical protein
MTREGSEQAHFGDLEDARADLGGYVRLTESGSGG